MWDPSRPKYPPPPKNKKWWKVRKRKSPTRKRLGGVTLNTWISGSYVSLKNSVDIGLWRSLGFYAWTSLYIYFEVYEIPYTRAANDRLLSDPTWSIIWRDSSFYRVCLYAWTVCRRGMQSLSVETHANPAIGSTSLPISFRGNACQSSNRLYIVTY